MFYFTLLKVELYGCFRVFLENFIFKLYSYKSYERSSNNQLMHCFRCVLVSVALFISAKRMIRENRENEVKKAASTVIVNHRQSRMFEKSMVKRLLDHLSVHGM